MSVLTIAPPTLPAPPPTHRLPPEPVAFNFTQSDSFAPLLEQLGVSLMVTTYQASVVQTALIA